jgi:hypothetical protein
MVPVLLSVAIIYACSWVGIALVVPSEVNIGGIFAPLSTLGDALQQREHLAAFIMAINEINDKTDGLYDDVLPNTTLRFAVHSGNTMAGALDNFLKFETSFSNEGVCGIVNTLSNDNALYVNQLATNMKIPTIMSYANNGAFYSALAYPFVTKVNSLVTHEMFPLQSAACAFGQKIALFVGLQDEDVQALYEMSLAFLYAYSFGECQLSVLAEVVIRADVSDMSSYVQGAIATGARYFVMMTPVAQTAAFLEAGAKLGLLNENTVVLTNERGAANVTDYFSAGTNVSDVLTGFFAIKYRPGYYTNRTDEAIGFSHRWREQPSTAGNGSQACDLTTDSTGNFHLYRGIVNNQTVCTGLDFSTYEAAGFDMQPYTALTYDATVVMAKAVHTAIYAGLDYNDATVLQNLLVSTTSHTGASGPISFNAGFAAFEYDGKGTRAVGLHYNITNFNPQLYTSGSKEFMATVGYYDADTRSLTICTDTDALTSDCVAPTFRLLSADGSRSTPPPDAPAPIYVSIKSNFSLLMVFYFMASLIALQVLVFTAFTIYYRRSKVVKASQPLLLGCIMLGGLVAAARIIVGSMNKSRNICVAEFWTGHLAFIIMIGSLFVKSYRVHCIINTRQLRRVTFSVFDAFKILIYIVLAATAYMVIATIIGEPYVRLLTTTMANQDTITKYCGMHLRQYQLALYACEAVLLIIGFHICWETRNVPDIVNESKQISSAMSVIVLVSLLILPIVYFLDLPPYTNEFVAALGFGFSAVITLGLIFIPKMLNVMFNTCNEDSKNHTKVTVIDSLGSSSDRPTVRKRKTKFVHDAEDLLRDKHQTERLMICQEQLMGWQAMVLNEQGNLILGSLKDAAPAEPRPGHQVHPHPHQPHLAGAGSGSHGSRDELLRHRSSHQALWEQSNFSEYELSNVSGGIREDRTGNFPAMSNRTNNFILTDENNNATENPNNVAGGDRRDHVVIFSSAHEPETDHDPINPRFDLRELERNDHDRKNATQRRQERDVDDI